MAFQSRVGLFPCVPSVAIPHRQFACETADITPERRRDCTQLFERKIALSSFQQVAAGHKMAPAVGFEPTTNRLTADRSTTELRWILFAARLSGVNFAQPASCGKCDFRPRTQIGNRFF